MTEGLILDLLRETLWVTLVVSTPVLATALVVGVAIGLVQALTSVQEMTLTFVPKLAAIVVIFWASMGFMTQSLTSYFADTLIPIIAGM